MALDPRIAAPIAELGRLLDGLDTAALAVLFANVVTRILEATPPATREAAARGLASAILQTYADDGIGNAVGRA